MQTPLVSPALDRYFRDYEKNHVTPGNKICHQIGIPLIMVTLYGLLLRVPLGMQLNLALLLIFLAGIFYVWLDWKVGVSFTLVNVGLYFFSAALPVWFLWAGFIFGWIIQFVGHIFFEKRSPSFFQNLVHIFIGPAWIFSRLAGFRPLV